MRRILTTLTILLASTAALAADGSVVLALGDRAYGDLGAGETDRIGFNGSAGSRVTLRIDAEFDLDVRLLDPADVLADTGRRLRVRGRRATLRTFVLPSSGRWTIEVQPRTSGGEYEIATSVRAPRKRKVTAVVEGAESVDVPLGDFPSGAMVDLKVKRGLVESLSGPAGTLPLTPSKRHAFTVASSGAWSASVVPSGTRNLRVTARVVLASPPQSEREVLDDDDGAGEPLDDDDVAERVILVRLQEGSDENEFEDRHDCDTDDYVPGTGYVRVLVPEEDDLNDFLEELLEDDDVIDGEPVLVGESPEGEQSNVAFTGSEAGRTEVLGQIGFGAVRATQARLLSTGNGIVVAVVDTGVQVDHPDLAGMLVTGIDLVDGDSEPWDVPNGVDDDGDGLVDEGVGHGTFVAGLIAALAPDVRILPVRVLDSDARGTSARVAEGIVRAVDAGAQVINLSLGIRTRARVIEDAVSYARSREVLVIAAAGNRSLADGVSFPASLSDVLAVTAVGPGDVRPGFANVSSKVDLAAPGVDVIAPYAGSGYATWSGTSFAAPFATAGAAMLLAGDAKMRPRDAADLLQDTADPVDAANPAVGGRLGSGRLNLEAALTKD